MANYPGALGLPVSSAPFLEYAGKSTSIRSPAQWLVAWPQLQAILAAGSAAAGSVAATVPRAFAGALVPGPATETFFETIVVLPRRHNLGIILATQIIALYIYNAYRRENRVFNAFVNNAGAGVTIPNLPTFPYVLLPQTGLALQLNVSADGVPIIDGGLLFDFDAFDVTIPITGQRAVLFPFEPASPLIERLEFLTDVIEKRNGKEQRVSLRLNPRQTFELTLELEGNERRIFDSIIFTSVGRPLGVPVWFEPSLLTAAIAIGATTISVDSTDYADFRVGGLAMVFQDEEQYEVLQVLSKTATTLTFTTAFTKAWAKNLRVMPMRVAFATSPPRGEKSVLNMQRHELILSVYDNDASLGSAAAFGTFDGKVFLDEPNSCDGSLAESWERNVMVFDEQTGTFQVTSDWPNARRAHSKVFLSRTRQRMWQVRQLLHHLRGRQTSFWIPTFFDELVPSENISSGSVLMRVENVGYAKFVQSRPARAAVQVVKTDGTRVARKVVTAVEIDTNVEQITVDVSFPATILKADVLRVEYLEKVRLDSDTVVIRHLDGLGSAEARVPVKAVYE